VKKTLTNVTTRFFFMVIERKNTENFYGKSYVHALLGQSQ
jgi:hypothetical protein